ncbi:hypothetical protein CDL15_Pgr017627 [Punica granatum]|uniref:Uncharacterized protein n=1 Tax=Punica granatum TaxID=22663 RepID=A0A218W6C0_PUNGR|nr:hypothetical protein CDL15_Pgr017627 [Punica granatum]
MIICRVFMKGSNKGGEKGNEVGDTNFEANDYDESEGDEFECGELLNDGDDDIAVLANLRNYRLRKSKGESSSRYFEQVKGEGLHDVQFEGHGLHYVQVMEASEEDPPAEAHHDYTSSNDEVMTPENGEDEDQEEGKATQEFFKSDGFRS